MREQFTKLNHIKKSLENKNIIPALEWVNENRSQLNTQVIRQMCNLSKTIFYKNKLNNILY